MAVVVRLLGRPRAFDGAGTPLPGPRGRKSWALLTVLLINEAPPTRRWLAELLFAEADDPLGALRWSLAELRRTLGVDLCGDPVVLRWRDGARIDVPVLEAVPDSAVLLEGIDLPDSPLFESWLLLQRRRQSAAIYALLREKAMIELAGRRTERAIALAGRMIAITPLDESGHTLLVRALTAAADRPAAEIAAQQCELLFKHELGVAPSPAIRAALETICDPVSAQTPENCAPARVRGSARAQLSAGKAALAAGATEAGIDCLRHAVAQSRAANDAETLVGALTMLGSALVHAVRGRDEEGASLLHEALQMDASPLACRELAFIDVQAGRRARATHWLDRARAAAAGDDRELAAIDGVRGMNLSDAGHYEQALPVLIDSVDRALHCGSPRQAAWSASLVGRLHLLTGSFDNAARSLATSLELVDQQHWLAFQPWPEAFVAELDIVNGERDAALQRLSDAFALACHLADPCWEAITGRGLAVLDARHDPKHALELFDDALVRCVRWPDTYQWVLAYTLDAARMTAFAANDPSATQRNHELTSLAARADMPQFDPTMTLQPRRM